MNKARYGLLILLFIILIIQPVMGYTYLSYKWPTTSATFSYSGTPSSFSTPVLSGAVAWNGYSKFKFSVDSSGNSVNKIKYASLSSNILAHTVPTLNPSDPSALSKFEIVFNSDKSWNTASAYCPSALYDVQDVAAHEFGHTVKLDHPKVNGVYVYPDATMYYSIALGETKKRTLWSDDINGIRSVYGT